MNPTRRTVYPRSVGNLALADVEPQIGLDSALDDSTDPSPDNLSAAMGILGGIGLSAFLWGIVAFVLYGYVR